ncbi:MAG: hypothetical protein J6S67_16690 [Methanobrevibacter sp.]|nr:hypothetical protein [Methanobrevibacter sp.]
MKKFRFDYIFDGIALALAGVQVELLFKWVQLGLGLLATILSIAFSVWQWWKKAKQDGKITEEEFKEGVDIIKHGSDEIKHHLEDKK